MSEDTLQENSKIQQKLRRIFQDELLSQHAQLKADHSDLSLITLTIRIDRIDPLACVEILRNPQTFQFYWEQPERDFGMAGGGTAGELKASGSGRFHTIEQHIQDITNRTLEISEIEHSQCGLHFLGGFSFGEMGKQTLWEGFEEALFTIPEWLIIKDGSLGLLTLTLPFNNRKFSKGNLRSVFEERIRQITPLIEFQAEHDGIVKKSEPCWTEHDDGYHIENEDKETYKAWTRKVNEARQLIQKGRFEKIVLSRKINLQTSTDIEPTRAINRLRSLYTNCYCFMIEFPGSKSFIGCSPERLVQFNPRYILTDALAGSISRGTSATQDMVFENRLLSSEKNLQEHSFVVEAIRRQLDAYTTDIQYPDDPVVKKLSNVQHLYTPILAWLKSDTSQADILQQLHPTPAVGGYPTPSALSYIPKLELYSRGWYAGPVGWLNSRKGGEFTVAIRSGLIEDSQAHFFAGCGIVKDSDPELEWEETKLKLIPMLSSVHND